MRRWISNSGLVLAFPALLALTGCNFTTTFTFDPSEGDAPLEVEFRDLSNTRVFPLGNANVLIPITSREWDFGDGATSSDQNPTHTYENPGTYTVTLKAATKRAQGMETVVDAVTVNPTSVEPVAKFTESITQGRAPLEVTFSDLSEAGSHPITKYEWNFGDGGTSSLPNPTYIFDAAGTYTVALKVTTGAGTDTRTKTNIIRVLGDTFVPRAEFTASVTRGAAPLAVKFNDTSDPGSEEITSWQWQFGDGTVGNTANPSHTYEDPGVYSVSLKVSTSVGSSTRIKNDLIIVTSVR